MNKPNFTTRHYIALAAAITKAKIECADEPRSVPGLVETECQIAMMLARDNPNFSHSIFAATCNPKPKMETYRPPPRLTPAELDGLETGDHLVCLDATGEPKLLEGQHVVFESDGGARGIYVASIPWPGEAYRPLGCFKPSRFALA